MRIDNSKISRYKLVLLNKKRYLIDMDTNKLIWFFPMFVWQYKLKALEITEEQYSELKRATKYSESTGLNIAAISLGGAIYTFLRSFMAIFFKEVTMHALITYVVVTIALAIGLRGSVSLFNRKKLKKYIDKQEFLGDIHLVEMNSYYRKICFQSMLIFFGVYLFLFYLYIAYLEVIVLTIIALLSFVLLFLNTAVVRPYTNMEYAYSKNREKNK
ncbi:DUF443 family protein [Enterococcus rivorum]|uniref:DUF443 family protein n=1 Tax=Enterococcus rivorum TaxID=762845 RepID=A0A1E5KUD8_9ENTE|nr:DUF443 family protein [Enterococcus rivorum]MBP2099828.1 putative membrane protein (TIGR01218 family) [Enterococcus rivorum]OEH81515.1 hypothetical protein BCR26_04550 [Enterococcus rivorum]